MRKILSIFIVTLLIISCNQKQSDNYTVTSIEDESILVEQQYKNSSHESIDEVEKQEVTKKKIIKDGRLGIRVSDLENIKFRIDTIINQYGG